MLQNNVTIHEQEVSINIMKELKSSIQHSSVNLKISQEKLIFTKNTLRNSLISILRVLAPLRTSNYQNTRNGD